MSSAKSFFKRVTDTFGPYPAIAVALLIVGSFFGGNTVFTDVAEHAASNDEIVQAENDKSMNDFVDKDQAERKAKFAKEVNSRVYFKNGAEQLIDNQIQFIGHNDIDAYTPTQKQEYPISIVVKTSSDELETAIAKVESLTNNKVIQKYSLVFSGFSIVAKYNLLDELKNIAGVEDVQISNVYHPTDDDANAMGQIQNVWEEHQLKGEGMVISIIDSGMDSTHKDFRLSEGTVPAISATQANAAIAKLGYGYFGGNLKVPFEFNYADMSSRAENLMDTYLAPGARAPLMHGQHVAGIAGANGIYDEESPFSSVRGVAPEAQLYNMKVFSNYDNNTTSDALIKAIEDSAKLGADVINMSLGDETQTENTSDDLTILALSRISQMGIVPVLAAGNSGLHSSFEHQSNYSKQPLTDDNTIGSPGVAQSAITVANSYKNVENADFMKSSWLCRLHNPSDSNDRPKCSEEGDFEPLAPVDNNEHGDLYFANDAFKDDAINKALTNGVQLVTAKRQSSDEIDASLDTNSYDNTPFPGLGITNDAYWKANSGQCTAASARTDISGGYPGLDKNANTFVIVGRGSATFTDKANIVNQCGFKGIIFVNNIKNQPVPQVVLGNFPSLPIVVVSYEFGMSLVKKVADAKNEDVPQSASLFKISEFLTTSVTTQTAGWLNDLTSWGPSPDLSLKPEISAPGSNIYSTLNENQYGNLTGTSMAAPYVTGAVTLLYQQIKKNAYQREKVKGEILHAIENTASPIIDTEYESEVQTDENPIYSPRRQGAGFIHIDKALENSVTLTDPNDGDGAFELREIYCKEGDTCTRTKTFTLELTNNSNEAKQYTFDNNGGAFAEVRVPLGTYAGNYSTEESRNALANMGYWPANVNSFQLPWERYEVAEKHDDFIANSSVVLGGGNTVTLAANETKSLEITVTLPEALTPNVFVEGYLSFTSQNPGDPKLSAPWFGYFGDYYDESIIDPAVYCQPNITYQHYNNSWDTKIAESLANTGISCPEAHSTRSGYGYFNLWDRTNGTSLTIPGSFMTGKTDEKQVYNIDPAQQAANLDVSKKQDIELMYSIGRLASTVDVNIVDENKNVLRQLSVNYRNQWSVNSANWDGKIYNSATQSFETVPNGRYYFEVIATGPLKTAHNATEKVYYPVNVTNESPTAEITGVEYKADHRPTALDSYKTYVKVKVTPSESGVDYNSNVVYLQANGVTEPYEYADLYYPNVSDHSYFEIPIGFGQDGFVKNGDNDFKVILVDSLDQRVEASTTANLHAAFVSRFGATIANAADKVGGRVDAGILFTSADRKPLLEAGSKLLDYCMITRSVDWNRDCALPTGASEWFPSTITNDDILISHDTGDNKWYLNLYGSYFDNFDVHLISKTEDDTKVTVEIDESGEFMTRIPIDDSVKTLRFTKVGTDDLIYHDFDLRFEIFPSVSFVDSSLPTGTIRTAGSNTLKLADTSRDQVTFDVKLDGINDLNYAYKVYYYTTYTDAENGLAIGSPSDEPGDVTGNPFAYQQKFGRTITYATPAEDSSHQADVDCAELKDELNDSGQWDGITGSNDRCIMYSSNMTTRGLIYDSSSDNTQSGAYAGIPKSPSELTDGVVHNVTANITPGWGTIHLIVFATNPNYDEDELYYWPAIPREEYAYNYNANTGESLEVGDMNYGKEPVLNPTNSARLLAFTEMSGTNIISKVSLPSWYDLATETATIRGYAYRDGAYSEGTLRALIMLNNHETEQPVAINADGSFELKVHVDKAGFTRVMFTYANNSGVDSTSAIISFLGAIHDETMTFRPSGAWDLLNNGRGDISVYTNSANYTALADVSSTMGPFSLIRDGNVVASGAKNNNKGPAFTETQTENFAYSEDFDLSSNHDILTHYQVFNPLLNEYDNNGDLLPNGSYYSLAIHSKITDIYAPEVDVVPNANGASATLEFSKDARNLNDDLTYFVKHIDLTSNAISTEADTQTLLSGHQQLLAEGYLEVHDEQLAVSENGEYQILAYDAYGNHAEAVSVEVSGLVPYVAPENNIVQDEASNLSNTGQSPLNLALLLCIVLLSVVVMRRAKLTP